MNIKNVLFTTSFICFTVHSTHAMKNISTMQKYNLSPYELHITMKRIANLDEKERENALKAIATSHERIVKNYARNKEYQRLPARERWDYIKTENSDLADNLLITARNVMKHCARDEYGQNIRVINDQLEKSIQRVEKYFSKISEKKLKNRSKENRFNTTLFLLEPKNYRNEDYHFLNPVICNPQLLRIQHLDTFIQQPYRFSRPREKSKIYRIPHLNRIEGDSEEIANPLSALVDINSAPLTIDYLLAITDIIDINEQAECKRIIEKDDID
ncbi:MAG TPA: hypothetical protein VKU36_03645 [Candidatus Babeliales bacterium]|nr:hypothetical protein [Candidatus Babeliales bacterium]